MIISVAKILSDTMRRLRSKDLYRSVCVIFLYAVESQQACCWRYNNFITNTTANRPERNLVSDSHDFFSRPLNQSRVSFCFFFSIVDNGVVDDKEKSIMRRQKCKIKEFSTLWSTTKQFKNCFFIFVVSICSPTPRSVENSSAICFSTANNRFLVVARRLSFMSSKEKERHP